MFRRAALYPICIAMLACAVSHGASRAATITVVNVDSPGVGFNDPTPTAPVGGNSGLTLGEQRLFAVQRAADIWGEILPSDVTIRISASWGPLSCGPTFGYLGFAGARALESDFPGAEHPATWYPIALANKLAGEDLDPDQDDMDARFNTEVGSDECLTGFAWYLGLDNAASSTEFDLVTTALHEIAHGLGSLDFVDHGTGSLPGGQIDVYARFLFDHTANKRWDEMNDAERAASAIHDGGLVWDGPEVAATAPGYLGDRPTLTVETPPAIAGDYRVGRALFGLELTTEGVAGELVLADDGTAPPSDACEPLINAAEMAGKIALIDRGGCPFVTKVRGAQAAGAIAAVIVNHTPGAGVIDMGGEDPTIVIPSVMIRYEDGQAIRAALADGVNASLRLDPDHRAGADDEGRVLLYAPNPNQPGSSVSHWDFSTTPDLLMEPNIPDGIPQTGDLTVALFRDIGWFRVPNPVSLENLEGVESVDGIALVWGLGGDTSRDLVGVAVQRAEAPAGPFTTVTPELLEPMRSMQYLDGDVREGAVYWYRLLLVGEKGVEVSTHAIRVMFTRQPASTALMTPRERADGSVHLRYTLGESGTPVELRIYNVAGKRIRLLGMGAQDRGPHGTLWDRLDGKGMRVPPGVYFLRLSAGPDRLARKMVLLR